MAFLYTLMNKLFGKLFRMQVKLRRQSKQSKHKYMLKVNMQIFHFNFMNMYNVYTIYICFTTTTTKRSNGCSIQYFMQYNRHVEALNVLTA